MCGIFGIYSETSNVSNTELLFKSLKSLQHRGKDGYGISFLSKKNDITFFRNNGLIPTKTPLIPTKSCIGHLRYSTSGYSLKTGKIQQKELQPLRGIIPDFEYCLAHNGNIPNVDGHDTSFLNREIMRLNQTLSMEKRLINLMMNVPAAYCLLILSPNALYAIRDRYGIRPLCIGRDKNNFYVSSESCAFEDDIDFIRDVKPGEIIRIDNRGITSIFRHPEPKNSLCSFELLYFASPNSYIDGINIRNIRKNLGTILAKRENYLSYWGNYTVIGIPETGICSAKAYAKYLNLNYKQAIRKKKNETRTFIILDEEERKLACDKKFDYDCKSIRDKNVIIVDDTIVRGNIIKSIIKHLKKCGVGEIHIRIPAPPVIDICELGICITKKTELLMNDKTIEEARKELEVDSLVFLSTQELEHFPESSYNQCFTGEIDPVIKNFTPQTRGYKLD